MINIKYYLTNVISSITMGAGITKGRCIFVKNFKRLAGTLHALTKFLFWLSVVCGVLSLLLLAVVLLAPEGVWQRETGTFLFSAGGVALPPGALLRELCSTSVRCCWSPLASRPCSAGDLPSSNGS